MSKVKQACLTAVCANAAIASNIVPRQSSTVPDYVTRLAPLVYIDVNDPYLPSDIGAQILNTSPEVNFTQLSNLTPDIALQNLSLVNSGSGCTAFNACSVYLTARETPTRDQPWLHGVLPNANGQTEGATSAAVVVNDHGSGLVDAYYFYFYAFNQGNNVSGTVIGNHVGDWEHTMLRFQDGTPQTMWFSAHDSGFTYSYDAVSKNNSRPIVYSSLGGHANYPTPGTQSRNEIITINDTTSAGPLWDPILSAYFYTFTPTSDSNGTFTPAGSTPTAPTSWLYFLGKWGDKQLPDSDPNQVDLGGLAFAWSDGPTGPLDKDLNRTGTCPDSQQPCNTTTVLPSPSGNTAPAQTISRTETATVVIGTATGGAPTKASPSISASPTASSGSGRETSSWRRLGFLGVLLIFVL